MNKNSKNKKKGLFEKTYTEFKIERCNMFTQLFDVYHDEELMTLFRPVSIEKILPFANKGLENTLRDLLKSDFKSITVKLELD